MRWVVLACLASCVASNSVVCSDGSICPRGTVCDPHSLCVSPDQFTACDGKQEGAVCMVGSLPAHCQDGVCLNPVCGDGFIEIGEQCDDGNTLPLDGCSADCTSTETCGNHVVDLAVGEECDDGNHVDHDGCSSACQAEAPRWIQHSLLPPARVDPMAVYDSARDRMVIWSGTSPSQGFDDTWEWNGGEWLEMPTPVAPAARLAPSAAYDAARHEMVVYGGLGFAVFSDTWLWNGSVWRVADAPHGPGPRFFTTMGYDAHRERIVLFGGETYTTDFLTDTWEWDGSAWTQITTAHAPPPRKGASMTYDPKRGVLVLTGGQDPTSMALTDTWEYDGTDWTQKSTSAPTTFFSPLTYDTANQRALLYAGPTSLYAWNGSTWTTVTASGGPPNALTGAVLEQTSHGIILFGGDVGGPYTNETWQLANNTWTKLTDPGPRTAAVFAVDPARARAVLYGGRANGIHYAETWELSNAGWTLRANSTPPTRENACMAYDPIHRNLVMFGGVGTSGLLDETWVWDGAAWTQKFPAVKPSPRLAPTCAFDGSHVVVFGGGIQGTTQFGDAFSWDGSTWTPIAVPPELTARVAAAGAYDPVRKQLVMFGGEHDTATANFVLDETWLFDGSTWTRVAQDGFRPSGRVAASMAWNAARQTIVLTGGLSTPGGPMEAFEWDGTRWRIVPATNAPASRLSHMSAGTLDGGGILIYGGIDPVFSSQFSDRWELRWDSSRASDRCTTVDVDGDALVACADPDCWWVCTPLCPPGTTCDPTAPKCGDGICDANREDCHTCSADCTCAPVCGDGICDSGETGCPGDCP